MSSPTLLVIGDEVDLVAAAPLLEPDADVVILPTAAAYTGIVEAGVRASQRCEGWGTTEVLLVSDRAGADTTYFADRVRRADAVIVTNGSPMHLRTVLRDTELGRSLAETSLLILEAEVASVFGATMIDPRGGAPTTGLNLFDDRVFTTPSTHVDRSASLLRSTDILCVVESRSTWLRRDDVWREL